MMADRNRGDRSTERVTHFELNFRIYNKQRYYVSRVFLKRCVIEIYRTRHCLKGKQINLMFLNHASNLSETTEKTEKFNF